MNITPPLSTLDPVAWQNKIGSMSEKQQMQEATKKFEGILLRQFLNDALKPMIKGCLSESGGANEIYRYFFTDALSDAIVHSKSINLGKTFNSQNILNKNNHE